MIIQNEINFFIINNIWILINLFSNARVLKDKWIYKIKKDFINKIVRYKARWMIHNFK